jgi:putative transposase
MKAYSIDLRRKIIDAYNAQEGSYRQLAQRFRVSFSFVQTLLKRYKDTGRVEPLPHSGGRQLKLNSEKLVLLTQLVKENNDATLDELGEKLFQKTQVRVSRATLGKLLQKLQLTRKKKRFMPVNKTPSE